MPIYGYARVSTDGQTLDAQRAALSAAGAEKIFQETASGAKTDRRELSKALKVLNLVIEFAILAMCLVILVMAEPKYCFPAFAMNSTATNISMKYIYFSQFLTFIILPVSYLLDIVRTALSWNDTAEKED